MKNKTKLRLFYWVTLLYPLILLGVSIFLAYKSNLDLQGFISLYLLMIIQITVTGNSWVKTLSGISKKIKNERH